MYIYKTTDGILLPHTKDTKPIDFNRKMTFNKFMSIVWACSETNLHYIDFKRLFEADMKRMFRPVKIEKMDPRELEEPSESFPELLERKAGR